MWVNPYRPGSYDNINPGMGVQFVELTAQQREQIVNLVRTFAYLSDDEEPKGNELQQLTLNRASAARDPRGGRITSGASKTRRYRKLARLSSYSSAASRCSK